jgi:hypothetical protein
MNGFVGLYAQKHIVRLGIFPAYIVYIICNDKGYARFLA